MQALHYKELEYMSSPLTAVESLVHICNQLRLPDAASGILNYTMRKVPGAQDKIAADWYEKLCLFDQAHQHYREQMQVRAACAL
jgi:serine/threonine-protein kinase mTOR